MIILTYYNMSEKKEFKNNVRFLSLSSYQTPLIKEEYNDDYVCFGEDNDYFDDVKFEEQVADTPLKSVG